MLTHHVRRRGFTRSIFAHVAKAKPGTRGGDIFTIVAGTLRFTCFRRISTLALLTHGTVEESCTREEKHKHEGQRNTKFG